MSCTATADRDELEFVGSLYTRTREAECRGPLLLLRFEKDEAFQFQKIFASQEAAHLLWDGYTPSELDGLCFELCGAHWLDLATLIWIRAKQQDSVDYHLEADHLLRETCRVAGWDAKEIVNLFHWQRLG